MPLVILAFWIGIYSKPFTQLLAPVSQSTVAAVNFELPDNLLADATAAPAQHHDTAHH
jgi:hypothetical protein